MYIVTGGAGFFGSNILRRLLADGEKVRVLDDFLTGRRENLDGLKGFEVFEGSITDPVVVSESLTGIEYVLHQGAIASVPRSILSPYKTMKLILPER